MRLGFGLALPLNRKTGAGVTPTTWDPGTLGANIALSGANLIATKTVANSDTFVRSSTSKASGKWAWEEVFSGGGLAFNGTRSGFCNAAAAAAGPLGGDTNSIAMVSQASGNSVLVLNGSNVTFLAVFQTNLDRAGWHVDFTAKLLWVRVKSGSWSTWNNNGSADPATGIGGIDFSTMAAGPYFAAACPFTGSQSDAVSFVGTALDGGLSSGFSAWG